MALSRDEIVARSKRLYPDWPVNQYTGTLNDPFQEAQSRYADVGGGWSQFFGELQKQQEDAELAGKSFKVGWGGFGNEAAERSANAREAAIVPRGRPTAAYTGTLNPLELNPLEQQTAKESSINQAVSDEVDRQKAMGLAQNEAAKQIQQGDINDLYSAYQQHVSDSFLPEAATATTRTPGRNGQPDTYTVQSAPLSPRERMLASVPAHLRPGIEQTFQKMDLAKQQADADIALKNAGADLKRAQAETAGGASADVKDAVTGMKEGHIPPQLPGRATKEYLATLAEAKRQGYDLVGAVTDWNATQKHVSSLNGPQQLRLNQSINALPELLDSVDALASQWKGGRFPILNKANLALAKNGAYGPDVATVANKLDAQIADVTADLGNVYMGGNSPTDHSLGLAAKSLSADWNEEVLHNMVNLARANVKIRQNSVRNTGVAGASPNNPYAPPAGGPPAGGPDAVPSGPLIYARDPQGNIHAAKPGTPLRPGWTTASGPGG